MSSWLCACCRTKCGRRTASSSLQGSRGQCWVVRWRGSLSRTTGRSCMNATRAASFCHVWSRSGTCIVLSSLQVSFLLVGVGSNVHLLSVAVPYLKETGSCFTSSSSAFYSLTSLSSAFYTFYFLVICLLLFNFLIICLQLFKNFPIICFLLIYLILFCFLLFLTSSEL